MDFLFLIYILLAIFLGALVRSYFGFGEALVSMPLLSIIGLDFNSSISIVGLAGLCVAIFYTISGFKNIKLYPLVIMLTSSIIGIPIGIFILHNFDTNKIQEILAIFLILYGFLKLIKNMFFKNTRNFKFLSPIWSSLAGVISGILGSLYNTHGVPIVIYATLSKWKTKEFQNTIQAHFLFTSIFVVLGQATGNVWTDKTIPIFLITLPFLITATFIGKKLAKKTSNHNFENWIYLLIGILGILLFISK